MIKIGSNVSWVRSSQGIKIDMAGKVVKVVHHDDIVGPRRLVEKKFPGHTRMFSNWGIPGKAEKAYLIEVIDNKGKMIYMPDPKAVKLLEEPAMEQGAINSLDHKATYKDRQHLLEKHVVNFHRFSTRGANNKFTMGNDKNKQGYYYDNNGCLRKVKEGKV